jgi:hypothetical protein
VVVAPGTEDSFGGGSSKERRVRFKKLVGRQLEPPMSCWSLSSLIIRGSRQGRAKRAGAIHFQPILVERLTVMPDGEARW